MLSWTAVMRSVHVTLCSTAAPLRVMWTRLSTAVERIGHMTLLSTAVERINHMTRRGTAVEPSVEMAYICIVNLQMTTESTNAALFNDKQATQRLLCINHYMADNLVYTVAGSVSCVELCVRC